MAEKARRFFYHYFKAKDKMSVHFAGACHVVDSVDCRVPCESHRQKRQPRLIMRGFARRVVIANNAATIE